jgi:poly(ADP-ribose) glycohydrolase ARH3
MRDRFVNGLLGLALGDAIGAPYEGLPAEYILHELGPTPQLVAQAPTRTLHYTDDTEMTLGVAETLIAHGRIDEDALVEAFARNYHANRGYGQGARRVIEAMIDGNDWRTLAATFFPGGSLGDDVDTLAAMTGALVGAAGGALPQPHLDALENGPRGRDYLCGLGEQLHAHWLADRSPHDSQEP